MSKRKHEQSFCYAPSRECGCILSIQFFSGNSSRGWRRRKYAGIIHIPGCICHFALGFCKNIKKRTETLYQSFSPFMVEPRGVEPLSESASTGCSPGADGYCGSLSPCSPSGRQAVTPSGQVRVIMRGRGNSYPPHGRHINDAFPGLWPLRFRRPPLIRQQ